MMNRGKLEKWFVRLYMINHKLRINKSGKADALRKCKILATKLSEPTLIDWVDNYLTALEVL